MTRAVAKSTTPSKEAAMDERPVLICYDGSLSARHAIGAAADLLAPHRAVVLDVASPLTVAESAAALGPMMPDFARPNSEEALARARAGAELAHAAGFTAEARTTVAAPTWQGIVQVADEVGAIAIAMGSRGHTGVRELTTGSLSHQVAVHAARPVLIVPQPVSR
jgi:nucleotide-binding universal stress UspA family protein